MDKIPHAEEFRKFLETVSDISEPVLDERTIALTVEKAQQSVQNTDIFTFSPAPYKGIYFGSP